MTPIHVPDHTWDPNGHRVIDVDEFGDECTVAALFLCPHCACWCPWGLGAADDMPEACDPCWGERHAEGAAR